MNYLHQPITGLVLKTTQLFSGRGQGLKDAMKNQNDADKYTLFSPSQISQIVRRVTLMQPIFDSLNFRILWADDNPVNNQPIEEILEKMSFNIDNAGTTSSAIDLINYGNVLAVKNDSKKYDLVITDFSRSNGSNGVVMADSIRQIDYDIPIIMFSSSFDENKGIPQTIFAVAHRADYLINYI